MTQSKCIDPKRKRKVRLCQLVAKRHLVERSLNTAQLGQLLSRSPKTIRRWLQQQLDCPKAFKDKNEWHVKQSELDKWLSS